MTDDSPYQDAKEFREALKTAGSKLDKFFRDSTGKVLGPAATKAREGLKSWWRNKEAKRKAEMLKGPRRPAGEPKAWWPPFGWGQPQSPAPAQPGPANEAEPLEPLDPPAPDEMVDV